jgi:hypothetical protein
VKRRARTAVLVAAVLGPAGADGALARADRAPDAEIFASSTTALITDPADPRLQDRLPGFRREVRRIVRRGGGVLRGSRLLDGVFSPVPGLVTLQRSREFDVERVSRRELRDIADAVRRRFGQLSVLTFDYPERRRDPVDAVRVEVPGVDVQRLRFGLLADAQARAGLMGGSVTLSGRLVLVAGLADLPLVARFVTDLGGRFADATVHLGHRELVAG